MVVLLPRLSSDRRGWSVITTSGGIILLRGVCQRIKNRRRSRLPRLPKHSAGALKFALIIIFEILPLMPECDSGVRFYGAFGKEEYRQPPSAAVAARASAAGVHLGAATCCSAARYCAGWLEE